MAEPTGPDWTAKTQAFAAVVQAIGAILALIAAYLLAKRSHDDAKARDKDNEARRARDHEKAVGVLLLLMHRALLSCHEAAVRLNTREFEQCRGWANALIARAQAAHIDALEATLQWDFLDGCRIFGEAVSFMGLPQGVLHPQMTATLQVALAGLHERLDRFEAKAGRSPGGD